MMWGNLGKILLRAVPIALEIAENSSHAGAGKREVFTSAAASAIKEFRPDIASHPKVIEALGKIGDANVDLQNIVKDLLINPNSPNAITT